MKPCMSVEAHGLTPWSEEYIQRKFLCSTVAYLRHWSEKTPFSLRSNGPCLSAVLLSSLKEILTLQILSDRPELEDGDGERATGARSSSYSSSKLLPFLPTHKKYLFRWA